MVRRWDILCVSRTSTADSPLPTGRSGIERTDRYRWVRHNAGHASGCRVAGEICGQADGRVRNPRRTNNGGSGTSPDIHMIGGFRILAGHSHDRRVRHYRWTHLISLSIRHSRCLYKFIAPRPVGLSGNPNYFFILTEILLRRAETAPAQIIQELWADPPNHRPRGVH